MWQIRKEFFFTLVLTLLPLFHGVSSMEFATLDEAGKYNLSWTYNDTDITFTLTVKTTGWVGFGFSPNGGMPFADIVNLEPTDNGGANITDTHVLDSNGRPTTDAEQDWTLVSFGVKDDITTATITRKLIICRPNKEDMSIGEDTMRLIYAYGTGPKLTYHGIESRGTKSMYLLVAGRDRLPDRPANAIDYDLIAENIEIPANETTYWCTLVAMPIVTKKNHVISFEPIIQPGNEEYVHHILIEACYNGINGSDYINSKDHSHECFTENMPEDIAECGTTMFAWAVGGGKFTYPAEAGLAIGDGQAPDYVVVQTHYDNPKMNKGMKDSSGIRITYTETLRQYDVDSFSVGSVRGILVPPRRDSTDVSFFCSSECMEEAMPDTGLQAFAGLLHSHLLGRKIVLRHTRPNGTSDFLLSDRSYDFNYQETRYLPENVPLNKGDSLQVTCAMGNNGKDTPTYGGLATSEEMCIAYIYYYPRIPLRHCSSSPVLETRTPATMQFYNTIGVSEATVKSSNGSVRYATKDVAWTPQIGQLVEDSYFNYDHLGLCLPNGHDTDYYNANFNQVSKDSLSRGDTAIRPCSQDVDPVVPTEPNDKSTVDPSGDGTTLAMATSIIIAVSLAHIV